MPITEIYDQEERHGVVVLVVASIISLTAVVMTSAFMLIQKCRGEQLFPKTSVGAYYGSLLLANGIQSVAGIVTLRWIELGGIEPGALCNMQGGWKNSGNDATALFSLLIAIHIFNTLFLRLEKSRVLKYAAISFVWAIVMVIVFVGPVFIEREGMKNGKGPYFGPSGLWCWITKDYKVSQTLAEYAIMFACAFLAFFIYIVVFIRMRGNLIGHGWKMRLQWIPREEAWRLDLSRDEVDKTMFAAVRRMVWYPIAYMLLILPIACVRFSIWAGHPVPIDAIIFADFVFNLTGFVNSVLLLVTRAMLPEYVNVKTFATRRKTLDLTSSTGLGVEPLILPPVTEAELERANTRRTYRSVNSLTRTDSNTSTNSSTSLIGRRDSEKSSISSSERLPRRPPIAATGTKRETLLI